MRYTLVVRYQRYSTPTHNIPTVTTYTLLNCILHTHIIYESILYVKLSEMGLQWKKFVAQKIIGKYLQIQGGENLTPLS